LNLSEHPLTSVITMSASACLSASGLSYGIDTLGWRGQHLSYLWGVPATFLFCAVLSAFREFRVTIETINNSRATVLMAQAQLQKLQPEITPAPQPGEIIPGVTNDFLREFLGFCSATNLTPIGGPSKEERYAEGSDKRRMAKAITQAFVDRRWAEPGSGNQSAKFINGWGAGAIGRALNIYVSNMNGSPLPTAPTLQKA
jgi:hypothetical protein